MFELSSPYGFGPPSYGSSSISSIQRKGVSTSYNPIIASQEEEASRVFEGKQDQSPPSVALPPGKTGKFGVDLVVEIAVCTFAVAVAVPFIWLAVRMAEYHHVQVTASDTSFIENSTRTASTFFTIFFAAVLGLTLKRFATWRLEKGMRLGLLEQIMQSRTFFATITTQLSFRALNVAAVVLLLIWLFSPLGSQAALRLISIGTQTASEADLASYVDTIENNIFSSRSGEVSLMTALKPMYVSSMLGSPTVKASTMDLWGNVKIPYLLADAEQDADGWSHFSNLNLTESSYSALVGIPIISLANRNSSFVLETTYMNLDCSRPADEPLINISLNTSSPNGTFIGPNTTSSGDTGVYPVWQVALNQFVNDGLYFDGYPELLVNDTDAAIPQGTLLFQTRGPWVSRCKINQIYVESNVTCQSQSSTQVPACSVLAQRTSPQSHAPSTVTTISFPSVFVAAAYFWIRATDTLLESGYSSLTEYYLQNTSASFILSGNGRDYANYTNVTAAAFSSRLGQLLNTWFLASQVSADTMAYGLIHRNTTAIYTDVHAVYVCSWKWLIIYCVSIVVMLSAALFSIWCAFHTNVPDILGCCSSLTRDSRYFHFARGGSTLDGLERARILRNVEVRLGEVVDQSRHLHTNRARHDADEFGALSDGLGLLAVAPSDCVRTPKRGAWYA